MKRIIRLTESDLVKLVKKVISEQEGFKWGDVFRLNKQDCLNNFKEESGRKFGGGRYYDYKSLERNDGVKIYWDFDKKQWNDTYEKYSPGSDKKEVGKWKCENGNFIMYDKTSQRITYD
jgi:hypothetical protein